LENLSTFAEVMGNLVGAPFSYSIANFYGAIVNDNGCFLLTTMLSYSIYRSMIFFRKVEDLTPYKTNPK